MINWITKIIVKRELDKIKANSVEQFYDMLCNIYNNREDFLEKKEEMICYIDGIKLSDIYKYCNSIFKSEIKKMGYDITFLENNEEYYYKVYAIINDNKFMCGWLDFNEKLYYGAKLDVNKVYRKEFCLKEVCKELKDKK